MIDTRKKEFWDATLEHCTQEERDYILSALSKDGEYIKKEDADALVDELARAISDERCFMPRGRSTANIMQDILDLPTYSILDSVENNVGMSMSHRAIVKVIDDYITNHQGDSDKQYTAYEIKALLISDDSAFEGKTNGGVIISLYPDLKYTIQNGRVVTTIGVASSFDLDWWNAPYQKGGET